MIYQQFALKCYKWEKKNLEKLMKQWQNVILTDSPFGLISCHFDILPLFECVLLEQNVPGSLSSFTAYISNLLLYLKKIAVVVPYPSFLFPSFDYQSTMVQNIKWKIQE